MIPAGAIFREATQKRITEKGGISIMDQREEIIRVSLDELGAYSRSHACHRLLGKTKRLG